MGPRISKPVHAGQQGQGSLPTAVASSSSSSMDTTPPKDNTPPENLLIQGVHCLYDPDEKPEFDVVFIPGLKADATEDHWWKTWTARGKVNPGECWPHKWLPERFPRVRVLAFSFGAPAPDQRPLALWERAINYANAMVGSDVGLGERPYFLVGHSVGGLLVKEILLMTDTRAFDKKVVENCKGIAFYGVPHLGTSANLETLFGVSFSFRRFQNELEMLGDKCYKRNLEFNRLASSIPSYNFAENFETEVDGKVHVVPPAVAAFSTSASQLALIDADHFDVCRPTGKKDMNFLFLVGFIKEQLDKEKISYREATNLV